MIFHPVASGVAVEAHGALASRPRGGRPGRLPGGAAGGTGRRPAWGSLPSSVPHSAARAPRARRPGPCPAPSSSGPLVRTFPCHTYRDMKAVDFFTAFESSSRENVGNSRSTFKVSYNQRKKKHCKFTCFR